MNAEIIKYSYQRVISSFFFVALYTYYYYHYLHLARLLVSLLNQSEINFYGNKFQLIRLQQKKKSRNSQMQYKNTFLKTTSKSANSVNREILASKHAYPDETKNLLSLLLKSMKYKKPITIGMQDT